MQQSDHQAIAQGGYLGIALLMVLENVFPPMPSEVIMGSAACWSRAARWTFVPLLIAGTIGSTAGNYVWFWVGDKWGYQRLARLRRAPGPLADDRLGRHREGGRFFLRHGQWVVFVLRFSPFMRTMISLPAGLAHMGRVASCCSPWPGRGVERLADRAAGAWPVARRATRTVSGWVLGGLLAAMVVCLCLPRDHLEAAPAG